MKSEVKLITIEENKLTDHEVEELHALGYNTKEAFVLPIKFEERFRVIAMCLREFMDNTDDGKKLDISDDLKYEITQLLSSLTYLLNSTSYRKGDKYYWFDKEEINRKLGR